MSDSMSTLNGATSITVTTQPATVILTVQDGGAWKASVPLSKSLARGLAASLNDAAALLSTGSNP